MSALVATLDRLFLRVRSIPFFYRFTLFTRILLAAGFIPTGWVKLMGRRFANISIENPIGAFFEAMYQTGEYWQFIGACQIVAGLMLLIPPTAHVGALLFLPIIANIFVITVALQFKGTVWVTGPMMLAVLYLCAWDYHRFRSLLTTTPSLRSLCVNPRRLDSVERIGFTVFGVGLLAGFSATRGGVPMSWTPFLMVTALLGGLLALGRFVIQGRRIQAPAP